MTTNKHKEKISSFLDNEMHHDELMSFSLNSELEDVNTIRRYQLVGDVLRGEHSEASYVDVSRAVHDTLVHESLAVAATTPLDGHVAGSVVGKAATKHRTDREHISLSAWFRPVAGMAVAASVALVMVVTLTGQDTSSPQPVAVNIERLPAAESAPLMRLAADDKLAGKKARNLDPRLVNQHLEFATQDALQGRLPYVRAVSYQKH